MPYSLTDELVDIRKKAEAVAESVCAPVAEAIDREARWPAEGMRALADAGLTGLHVPARLGGMEQGLQALLQVCEALGSVCASTSMCFGMHSVATAVIAAKSTEDQEDRFLRPIASGRHLSTLALSEGGTGSFFFFPQCRLTPDGGDYFLQGEKKFITNAGHADSYVISACSPDDSGEPGEFSCVMAMRDTPGMTWDGAWDGMGLRGNVSRGLKLDDVRAPAANLLGRVGDQIWYVFEIVAPYFLIAMAGTYVGLARSALKFAVQHIKNRRYEHSGGSPGDSEVVQHRLGEMWIDIERTRLLAYHAARQGDEGDPSALIAICGAKAAAADTAVRAANEAMTLCGGMAYGRNSELARLLRDARAAHVMSPTTDILKIWAGRILLGRSIL